MALTRTSRTRIDASGRKARVELAEIGLLLETRDEGGFISCLHHHVASSSFKNPQGEF